MSRGMAEVNRDEYSRLKRIVADALSQPGAARAAFIAERCGSDLMLLGEVESLLAAAIHASALYEDPTLLIAGAPLGDVLDRVAFAGTVRYDVRRRIGAGGMGIVYEVEDRVRHQVVALKTLRRLGADAVYQLKREFRNLADVAHPNLVALYDLVIDDEQCFFTMELVEGVTFVDYIRAPTESTVTERIRRALPQLIEGVEELHRRGMHHGDIKPSNVLVTRDDRVVVLDFGLTSNLRANDLLRPQPAGTPAYLSPEQCLGGAASESSDWYSVGATLYHALTGRLPFDGSVRDVIHGKTTEEPPSVLQFAPATPREVNDACLGLLHRVPAHRMSGREAVRRLQSGASVDSPDGLMAAPVFVGRESFLEMLDKAFSDVTDGRSASVIVQGPSGIGKTALVQRFIERHVSVTPALVLRSRCHEHESIPYNGLDGVVDGLTRYLGMLSPDDRSRTLPEDADVLATLFPILGTLGIGASIDRNALDPILLRRRAFVAFRALLGRVAIRQPLVVDIDDFQWADADSVAWVSEILRPSAPPSVMVVISFRSEEIDAKPFLRSLNEREDFGERLTLPLGPLSEREAGQLIGELLPPDRRPGAAAVANMVRDSGGNPFLVEALTRHAALEGRTDAAATLGEMLLRRLESLPGESRVFLETLALCGRPVLPARVFEACGFTGDERPLVARLKAAHLVRNSRSADLIEMYHDRIRETLAERVSPDIARGIHAAVAELLIAHGDDDPEALFEHHRAAGHPTLAAAQAAAAALRASGVLAFDLAVTFYRHALALDPESLQRPAWTAGMAKALENAGRPVEAADACLEASRQAASNEQIEWRRKATELLLIGGQIDRGLAVGGDVLDAVGMRLARGPRTAMASLFVRRLQLRWRGLEFTPRLESQIAPDDLLRIDTCWAISAGLAMVEPVRAAAFNVRQLLRALDVGDPYRVARAMALEAGFSVVGVGAGLGRSEAFSQRAKALADGAGHAYFAALTSLWEGIAAFLTGQWMKASEFCGRAATTFREECTGVTWELNMAHNFFLGGLLAQGDLREVARQLPGLLAAARERGNFYLELELNTRMILVWLAADDADGADRRGNEGIARWSQRGFQRQHYNHLLMRVQSELYRGRARDAWDLIEGCRRPLRRSLFLRVQHTRIEAANYRARCALAMAAAGEEYGRMRATALSEAKSLERQNRPWANAFARLLRATIAHMDGDRVAAVDLLATAEETFRSADMHLYACVCRRRLGSLVEGERGQQLRLDADRWMASQGIRNPDAMTRLIAPGYPD